MVGIMVALLALTTYALFSRHEAQHAQQRSEQAVTRSELDGLLTRSALERSRGNHGNAVQRARQVLQREPDSAGAVAALYASIGGRSERTILTGHQAAVRFGRFSPDGRHIATVSMDGTARIWTRGGQALAVIDTGDDTLHQVRWHPSGQRFATVSSNGTARVIDLAGRTLHVEGDPRKPSCEVAWDPRGALLLVGSCGGTAQLLDAAWQPVARLEGHTQSMIWASFTPDAEAIVTLSLDGDARIWGRDGALRATLPAGGGGWSAALIDSHALLLGAWPGVVTLWTAAGDGLSGLRPAPVQRLRVPGKSRYAVAAWHPDGRRFVTGAPEAAGAAHLYRQETHLATLRGDPAPLHAAAFSALGVLATADEAGGLRLWTDDGARLAVLSGHAGRVWSLDWSPDGTTLLSTSEDGTARLWNASGHAEGLLADEEEVDFCALSPPGDRVLTLRGEPTGPESVVSLYDRGGARLGRWRHAGEARVLALAWRPDGGEAALHHADGAVTRLDRAGRPRTGPATDAPVRALAYDHRGRLLTGDAAGVVVRWGPDDRPERRLDLGDRTFDRIVPAPDGERVAVVGSQAVVGDLATGALSVVPEAAKVRALCWRPDGVGLAATTEDGRVVLWDGGSKSRTLSGHRWRITGCAFSPAGGHLATASWDHTLRLFAADGAPLATLDDHSREVHDVSWSPDGRYLLTTSWDGTARLRDAKGTPLATLDGHGGEVVRVSWSGDGQLIATCARGGKGVRWWPGSRAALVEWVRRLVPDAQPSGEP